MIICDNKSFAEVANEVLEKLIEQGGPCLDGAGKCVYSDGGLRHCAGGWLFPNDSPAQNSGWGFKNLLEKHEAVDFGANFGWLANHQQELMFLQSFHDELACRWDLLKDGVDQKLMDQYANLYTPEE